MRIPKIGERVRISTKDKHYKNGIVVNRMQTVMGVQTWVYIGHKIIRVPSESLRYGWRKMII